MNAPLPSLEPLHDGAKRCLRCGCDLATAYRTAQMIRRSRFCGVKCWSASLRTSRVITDEAGTWVLVASGERARISPEDAALAASRSWHVDSVGYLATGGGRRFHRVILGATPRGFEIDHINHDQLDNRRENLRVVTHAANIRNHKTTARSTSGVNGVSLWSGRFWRARIWCAGRNIYLGSFRTRDEALQARRRGEDQFWGSER